MARRRPDIADWWNAYLSDPQRERLMSEVDQPLDPHFALELWRSSGSFRAVEPAEWSIFTDPNAWRLTAEVTDFVRARAAELRKA